MDIRKSGTNLKLLLTGETYDDMYVHSMSVSDSGQVSLIDGISGISSIPCWQVLVQSDPGNSASIRIGNHLHGCYIVIRPGESMTIPINRVEKVYVISVSGDQTVNWIAVI